MWDSGADISLITHSAASRLNLKGDEVELAIIKVGNDATKIKSKKYHVPLIDLENRKWDIYAYGMDEITADLQHVTTERIATYFPDIYLQDIARPQGKVDLLIGVDFCVIMPNVIKTVGNVQLLQNQFGYCIRGSFYEEDEAQEGHTKMEIKSNNMLLTPHINNMVVESPTNKSCVEKFFSIESLRTSCTPKCGGCRCGKCALGMKEYTLKEERELAMIHRGLSYNDEDRCFTVTYPWIRRPEDLPNNLSTARAKLRSTEFRLKRLNCDYQSAYRTQMKDMETRQVSRKLTEDEIRCYEGPVHYINHHEVFKANSSSTPIRIVFNASASYLGHSLNDYWAKGPDFVNSLYGILLRFREHSVAVTTDISKMYNSIKLSEKDQHVHRYLWRDMETQREPDHFVLTAVPFGDRPSGTIAMVALHTIADMNITQFPHAGKMIKENSYVDDLLQSVPSVTDALTLMADVQHVLALGNFKLKHWIVSGQYDIKDDDVKVLETKHVKILGLSWNPQKDYFFFEIKLNFSPKSGKTEMGPNIARDDIAYALPPTLTRKLLLRQIASIYDPLGLTTPFTLRGKLLMRSLMTTSSPERKQINWDEPVPPNCRQEWATFFTEMFKLEDLQFPRCVRPLTAVGEPTLVIFSDASSHAYGACAYVHWEVEPGKWRAFLISAKNRISPTRQLTIPRLELCGALIGCRLGETIQREMSYNFQEVVFIVDSIIVRSQIQKESYGFGTFVATRVAEIQDKSSPSQWWWINGSSNPADMVTRPTKPEDLGTKSEWQTGPAFLRGPRSSWPINQRLYEDELPDQTGISLLVTGITSEQDMCSSFNIQHFSSFDKFIRVTARIMRVGRDRSLKSIAKPLNVELISIAEEWWIKDAQKQFRENWKVRFQKLGPSITDSGIIVVGDRIAKWLKCNWNQDRFILLPAKHPLTILLMQKCHYRDHGGVECTLARLHSKYWVPSARRIIKMIIQRCVICRKTRDKPQGQKMGQVNDARLQPCPAFYNTALDLFGPFFIKDTVKRRTKSKVYGVLFTCLVTRATYIDLVEGYGTQDFLLALRRFITVRGCPATIYSDAGSQLVAAKRELREIINSWDLTDLENVGSNYKLQWNFTKSADAPWENGCCEALIRLAKRALLIAIGDSVLTFGEMQTVLYEVANLLNERPIGRKPGADPTAGTYLCPNDLLLGRTQVTPPQGPWAERSRLAERFLFLQRLVTTFWEKWYRYFFSSILIRQKWHREKRNMRVGDIVIVQENNPVRGKWRLAEIIGTEPNDDGNVRDVILRYKAQSDGHAYTGQPDIIIRSVHRLVLLIEAESIE